jgi:Rer1 family
VRCSVALLALFVLRMFMVQGFYIVTYVLLIFLLNQFILFVQPKDRASLIARRLNPEGGDATDTAVPALPTRDADEFRPFVRRLPEFKFWYSSTVATVLAIYATFFSIFDVPVFWPVLVFYFVMLFVATMRRQWLDMKRLKYVPWDIGNKKTYKSDPKKMSVMPRDAASVARAAMDSAVLHPRVSALPEGEPSSPAAAPPGQTVKRGLPVQ